jgi:enamine deaminase RidA (YjgF/YER057c/UK114 family)
MIERLTRPHMRALIEPYGLCEAVRAGGLVTLAGQTGLDESGAMVAGGLGDQARQAFRNLAEVLALAGTGPGNLVSLTWYLAETGRDFMTDALEITAAREAVFPGLVCAQTAVRVAALLTPEIQIEITAVAAV